ncbi:MAG: glycosyl hydrolase 2 galactose-binding domain-containing protein, partial [Halanaerobiaceae bacterium]
MLERLLNKGWQMFSSDKLDVFGEKISTEVYQNDNWYQVTIPGTVVSGLVENGVYPDPYYNNNIKELPGYKTGKNTLFSAHYMPDDSPFRSSWWFRNEFTIPDEWQGKKIWLYLKGINYSANIWMNGERIAGVGEVQGTYRLYQFDISKKIIQDKKNVLAIEVFAPQPDDLAMTFIDWCPVPPDDSMGIWQPVSISVSEDISLNNTFVRSSLTNNNSKAELIIISEVYNDTEEEKPIKISGKIDNCIFEKDYLIGAKEEREIKITAEDCPELIINNPKLWWPYQMGQPELYNLELKLYQGDLLCDKEQINFGIREIETYLNSAGSRMFKINGREIQLRGAAWAPDLMLRQSEKQ